MSNQILDIDGMTAYIISVDNIAEWYIDNHFEPIVSYCFYCQIPLMVDKPFRTRIGSGIYAGTCPCGATDTPYVYLEIVACDNGYTYTLNKSKLNTE